MPKETGIIRIDLDGVNSYLARGEGGFVLFDTGGHIVTDKEFTDRRTLLRDALDAAGCTRENLNLILLTHGDNDHACNAAGLREEFGAGIAIHAGDLALVESPDPALWMESFRYRSPAYRLVFRLLRKTITAATQRALEDFTAFSPDVLLEDGLSLLPYGLDATVLHLPGHTMGSVGVLTAAGELIAGDLFANNGKPAVAPNAADFAQLYAGVDRLRGLPVRTVYPGHGKPFPFAALPR